MARWGRCDFSRFKDFQNKIEKMQKDDFEAFCKECAKELAARLLAKVIRRTPVSNTSTGKRGGTLRRGWTASSEAEAQSGGSKNAKAYADSLNVTKSGDVYQIEIINPVNYASYVEYGHRTRNHKGWVQGRFMLTISEDELDAQAPKILENKLKKYLGECFNGE